MTACVAASLVLPPRASFAQTCPPGTETELTEGAQLAQNAAILAGVTGIFTFLQNTFFNQTVSALSANTSASAVNQQVTTEAMTRIQDVKNAQSYGIALAQAQAQAAAQTHPPNGACQPTTGMRAVQATNTVGDALLASALQGQINDDSNLAAGVEGAGGSSQNGTFAQSVIAFQHRQAKYAKCDEEGYSGCTDGILPNADVRPRIIFGYNTFYPNPPQQAANIQPDDLEAAAFDYCTNLLQTLNQNNLQNNALQSPAGIVAHMLRKSNDARMQLAQYACDSMVRDRAPLLPNSGTTDATQNVNASPCDGTSSTAANNTLCWGQQTLREIGYTSGTVPRILSRHQMMKVLYHDEFATPDWDRNVASNSGTQQLKMLVHLTALRLQMQWENYQQLEQILLMESANNASRIEKTRPDVSPGAH